MHHVMSGDIHDVIRHHTLAIIEWYIKLSGTSEHILFARTCQIMSKCYFKLCLPSIHRSAQEAQAVIDKAVSRGQVMPAEARFDSNCITPGTEFMWKLQKQLKYFVHKKTTTDPLWQQVKVVLSGQDVRIIM